ncbi:hypothetical protein [Tritonibacter mobilis]|uniref:hypothetical protein n=1 Tax=Tritonibacter mobilis TaxID=379347 RepID=UPI000806CFBD|nr:hypothetical protein [Tritonibacter mobilis]
MIGNALIIFWLLCLLVPEETGEVIRQLLRAIGYIGELFAIGIFTLVKLALRGAAHTARLIFHFLRLGGGFLYYFTAEILRGAPAENEAMADEPEPELEPEADCAGIKAARDLLQLPEDYTQVALDRAFKKAIRTAHPDAGGSAEQSQAVIKARDLLRARLKAGSEARGMSSP